MGEPGSPAPGGLTDIRLRGSSCEESGLVPMAVWATVAILGLCAREGRIKDPHGTPYLRRRRAGAGTGLWARYARRRMRRYLHSPPDGMILTLYEELGGMR